MLVAHYSHHLPADYDLDRIRVRAKERGPLWDQAPDLIFKAFLLRERGRLGATANSYSSLYLWQRDAAFRDFLVGGRYRTVTDSFGRAGIETCVALAAQRGEASEARFAYVDELAIPVDADLTATFAREIERNDEIAQTTGTVAALVGLDPKAWKFIRILLRTDTLGKDDRDSASYEVLHLARPLLDDLSRRSGQ